MEIGIGVARESERREAGSLTLDAEFLAQFADQGVSGRSPASTLPPGNSHRPASCFPFRALRDQHAAVGIDQRDGDDEEKFHADGPTRREAFRSCSGKSGMPVRTASAPAACKAVTSVSSAWLAPAKPMTGHPRPGAPQEHPRSNSSMTIVLRGSTPIDFAAKRKRSGAGLPSRATCSALKT